MPHRAAVLAAWMVMNRAIQRQREIFINERLRLTRNLMLLQVWLMMENRQRGPYCRVVGYVDRFLGAILRGEQRATKENLRINPNVLRRLVLHCSNIPKRSGWTIELQVIIFLFWLACGTSYRVVGCCFDIPRSTVHRAVHRVLNKVISLIPRIVRLPQEENLPVIGLAFARKGGSAIFRQCVGAIDGCHIRTVCPVALHDQYYNRKQFYSLNLQAMVDHTGKFIDILSGYPGSVHDSRIFRNSPLYRDHLYPPAGYFIIGDSGYPCRRNPITIVTPFREPLSPEKRAFNLAFSKARVIVEQAFGLLKARWRIIFTKALEVKIITGIKVIAACTVLHNICVAEGDVLRVNAEPPPLPPRRVQRNEEDGSAFRDLLLRLFTIEHNNFRIE